MSPVNIISYQPYKCIWSICSKFYKIYPFKTLFVLQVATWSLGGQVGSWTIGYDCFKLTNVFGAYAESFSHFGQDLLSQDSTCPPSINLESWRTGWFLTHSQGVLFSLQLYLQHVLKISFISDMNNPFKTLPILQVQLWRLGWWGNLDIWYGMWGVIYKYTMWPAFIVGVSRPFGAFSDEIAYLSILVLQKMGYYSVTKHI